MYLFKSKEPFQLENGRVLESFSIAYQTFGTLNQEGNNVVWVSHALTANSNVMDWWSGLFGPSKLFDPCRYFIVCPNILGSCYGSSGAATSENGEPPLLEKFPEITTRDMAAFQDKLRHVLGIQKIQLLIGPSLGGQQALEWAILKPELFDNLVLLATNAQHSPYGIALNESQRWAITSDPTYANGNPEGAKNGLALARSIAMISYRSYKGYVQTQSEETAELKSEFKASSYQRYQGQKLANRFSAYSYITLSKAMDNHNLGRGRGSVTEALTEIQADTLCIGITSDDLFPTSEQRILAQYIPHAIYREIHSDFGHDGFLIEADQLTNIIRNFLEKPLSDSVLGERTFIQLKNYQLN